MYEYARRLGFGVRPGSGLPGEAAGFLAEVDNWSSRTLETIAIGQEIGVTALQLAQAVATVAHGGVLLTPRIVKGVVRPDGEYESRGEQTPVRQAIRPETAALVCQILEGVVERGSGKKAAIEGLRIAGKTGTAQRASPDGRGYLRGSYIVSFIGFLPADNPELLGLVVVDNPRENAWGGTIAAPAFRRIVERILHLPNGVGIPAADSVQVAESAALTVPDLRGMPRHTARYQASLRGLPVSFVGSGDLVVAQDPLPGFCPPELAQVACTLGVAMAPSTAAVGQGLARQAHLLQMLAAGPPAVSAGGR